VISGRDASLEARIGRLLSAGTYASIALVAVGVVLMAASGRSPLDIAPGLDLGAIAGDMIALRPAGFLWLGLLLVLFTPSARVAAALVAYVRAGERGMAAVAVMILLVIALGVAAGTAGL
jgi:uncharacterized membrane protein